MLKNNIKIVSRMRSYTFYGKFTFKVQNWKRCILKNVMSLVEHSKFVYGFN